MGNVTGGAEIANAAAAAVQAEQARAAQERAATFTRLEQECRLIAERLEREHREEASRLDAELRAANEQRASLERHEASRRLDEQRLATNSAQQSANGGGNGNSAGGENNRGGPFWNGATEIMHGVYKNVYSTNTLTLGFRKGTTSAVYTTHYDDKRREENPAGRTTYHADGNVHYHGTHWDDRNGKLHGFRFKKER